MTQISAQVSLYPLGQGDYIPPIDAFIEVVAQSGLEYEVHTMSTEVSGDDEEVFRVMRAAYRRAAQGGPAVMVLTVTNACPSGPDAAASGPTETDTPPDEGHSA